jgi:hypothetical protein
MNDKWNLTERQQPLRPQSQVAERVVWMTLIVSWMWRPATSAVDLDLSLAAVLIVRGRSFGLLDIDIAPAQERARVQLHVPGNQTIKVRSLGDKQMRSFCTGSKLAETWLYILHFLKKFDG